MKKTELNGSSSEVNMMDAPGGNFEFSLLDLLVAVLKWKREIALTIASFSVVAIIISFIVPATYTATTRLMPPQQNQSISSAIAGQLGPLAGLAGKDLGGRNSSELYVAIMRSESVVDALIQKFNLMSVYKAKLLSDARKRLSSRSEMIASKEGIISVSVDDRDPKLAAALANGYVDQLFILNQTLAVTEAGQRRIFFQQQLEDEKNALSNAEVSLKQNQEKSGLIQLDSQTRAIIEQNSVLEAELAAAEVQLNSMSSFATSENPDFVQLRQRRDALRTELAKSRAKHSLGGAQLRTQAIPELGLEYIRRVRDVKYHEALYELLMRQYEVARLDEAKNASIIQVLDKAQVPDRRSSPRRLSYLAAGFGLGLLVSFSCVVVSEFKRKASSDPVLGPKLQKMREYSKLTNKPKLEREFTPQ